MHSPSSIHLTHRSLLSDLNNKWQKPFTVGHMKSAELRLNADNWELKKTTDAAQWDVSAH